MKFLWRFLLIALLSWSLTGPAGAVAVDKPLEDPVLEERARELHKQLRCLVCQNQSIEESNADLARDLRVLVRDLIREGKSDAEVIDYLVARYGDWVLLEPPFRFQTLALWLGPLIIFALALVILLLRRRQPEASAAEETPLNDEEKARLAAVLSHKEPEDKDPGA